MYRNLLEHLKLHLSKKEFTIITGARQTGKSTLLRQLETHCKNEKQPCIFLNLENKEILMKIFSEKRSLIKSSFTKLCMYVKKFFSKKKKEKR